MHGGNKKLTHTKTFLQLQVCLSMCNLLLPPGIKGLIDFPILILRYIMGRHYTQGWSRNLHFNIFLSIYHVAKIYHNYNSQHNDKKLLVSHNFDHIA